MVVHVCKGADVLNCTLDMVVKVVDRLDAAENLETVPIVTDLLQ